MLIDTHCHLDFHRFEADRDEVIQRAAAAGVRRIIVPAIDLENAPAVLDLADRYEVVYAAVGVHPNASADWRDEWLPQLRELSRHPKVVAVGEIGLDYYRDRSPAEVQKRAMEAQLKLAAERGLPVIIHNRHSSEDVVQLLSTAAAQYKIRGVLHSFSADWAVAQAVLDLGFYVGITGPIGYKNATELREVVSRLPAQRLLVETDAPFLAPQRFRGKRNEPAYVKEIVESIAQVRGESAVAVAAQTTANAQRLFGALGL